MTTHRIVASQLVPRPLDEVFAFFARPDNLGRITPAAMGFEFLTADRDMRAGLEMDYSIRPLLGIPLTWRTRITEFDPPNGFRDIQLKGPYRRWEHVHRFEAVDGGTMVHDEVTYAIPFEPLGDLVNRLFVRSELERIFRHRADVVRRVFAPAARATGRTVVVVGGTGFVGGGVADALHRRGDRVAVISHQGGEKSRGGLPDDVEIRHADVTSGDGLIQALQGADAVVVALAFKNLPMEAPRRHQTFDEIDAGGTERVVAAAVEADVRRIVYVSGAGAAPDADRHWFRAKWRAEEAVRASGLTWTIIRPTWVFGPRDVALNRFVGFARRLGMVPLTNAGNQELATVFVDDVGRLVADSLATDAAANQVFELGGPETLRMRGIVATALRVAGLRRPIVPGPTPLLKLAAIPLSWLPSPLLTSDAVDFINQPAVVDTQPLLARMPRRLTPLAEGLATYLGPTSSDAELSFDGRVIVRRTG